MITSTNPSPPLGPYPQPLLWGHLGIAPTNKRTTMINSINPSDMGISYPGN